MFKYAKRIFRYIIPYKSKIFIVFLCSLVTIVVNYFNPIFQSRIVDDGLIKKDLKVVCVTGAIMLAMTVTLNVVNVIMEKNRVYIFNSLNYDLRRESFKRLLTIKLDFFNNRNSNSISNMISEDVGAICAFIGPEAFMVLTGFLSAVSATFALFSMNWKLGLAVLLFIPLNFAYSLYMTKMNRKNVLQLVRKNDEYNNWFGDSVNGIKEIRLFGLQKLKMSQINEKQKGLVDLNVKRGFILKLNEQIEILMFEGFSIALYIVGGFLMVKNGMTVGQIITFATYSAMVSSPIVYSIKMIMSIMLLTPNIERHFELMDYESEPEGELTISSDGDIEFKHVNFAYAPETPLIDDLNFTIQRGSKVALLGKNGIGKTTTLNLILRFLSIDGGNIMMDGHDISDYEITSYRRMFAVVSQEVFLFNDTVENNICLYNDYGQDKLNKIIDLVNLREFVDERGLDYNVGCNGNKLSGGQKQKIALARALINDCPIIILDEATSNLDLDTVCVIKDLFMNELSDHTVICVTHTKEISDLFETHITL